MTSITTAVQSVATTSTSIVNELRLDYETLCKIADLGIEWNYNRQLCSEKIRTIRKGSLYKVIGLLEHHHRNGVPCEVHMRMVIQLGETIGFADVPMDFFNNLKSSLVVRDGDKPILKAFPTVSVQRRAKNKAERQQKKRNRASRR